MRRYETQTLGNAIQEFMKAANLDKRMVEASIINQWEDIIGKNVAKATKEIYIKNRTLHIKLQSSVIRAELFMIREGLISSINERAGQPVIDRIVLK